MFIFKREKEIINKCRDYLEEKIINSDFFFLYLEDKMIMKKIRKSAIKNKHGYIDEYSIEDIKKVICNEKYFLKNFGHFY